MAPMALVNEISAKRTSTDAEFDIPFAKRQNLGVIPRHKPAWDLNTSGRSGPLNQDEGIIQSLLTRSIELALEAVGFGAAEQAAMESFRAGVEECMKSYNCL